MTFERDKEYWGTDPFGKAMPRGMYFRNGVYKISIMIHGVRRKATTKKRTLKDAEREHRTIVKAWEDGASGWIKAPAPTLKEYWEKTYRPTYTVLKTPIKRRDPRAEVTFRDDQLIQYALHPTWGLSAVSLDKITSSMCQQWTNRRRTITFQKKKGGPAHDTAEGTVTREVSFLKAVFQTAVDNEVIDRNPWKAIKTEPYESRERVLLMEEQEKLLPAMSRSWSRGTELFLCTGLRLEEYRSVDEKTDLDFPKRFVRVTRKTHGRKKRIQEVPLIAGAWSSWPTKPDPLDLIQEQLTEVGELWHQDPSRFREVLREACVRSGVDFEKVNPNTGKAETISPHCLRHTFATRALQSGADIYVVSQILGHSSVKTTEKHYAHLLSQDLATRMADIAIAAPTAGAAPAILPFHPRSSGARRGGRS